MSNTSRGCLGCLGVVVLLGPVCMICPHIDLRRDTRPTISEVEGPDTVTVGNSVFLFCKASDADDDALSFSWSVDGKNDSLIELAAKGKKGVEVARFTPITVASVKNANLGGGGWPNVEFWAPSAPGLYTIVVTVRDRKEHEVRFEKHITVLKRKAR
jgi:hypothetical protein